MGGVGEDGGMRDTTAGQPLPRTTQAHAGSPKDRFITVYGRNPVIEALTACLLYTSDAADE